MSLAARPGHASPPLSAAVRRIVTAAATAPTAENCQPWSFHWDGERLAVFHDPERARHALNYRDRISLVTLGCLLEVLSLAASAEALDVEAQTSLSAAAGEPWATVRFARRSAPAHELSAALAGRATDRRLYQGGTLTEPLREAIRDDAARIPGCAVHFQDRFSPELVGYLAEAESYVWRRREIYLDVMRWVRFSDDEIAETRDGAHLRSLGFDLPGVFALRGSRSALAQRILSSTGLFLAGRLWLRMQLASSAALLCITVRSASKEDLVAAGRLGLLAWLRLNQVGYGVQPFSHQSLPIYHQLTGGLPDCLRPDLAAVFARGRDIVARAFHHAEGEIPVWMLRTGLSAPLAPRQRTPRRPLAAFYTEAPSAL